MTARTLRQQYNSNYPKTSCTGALTPPPKLKTIIYPDNTKEHFTYTKSGQIETHTSREGIVQRAEYDCLNRVIKISSSDNTSKLFDYDKLGNVASVTDEFGNTTHYSYTLTGKLACVRDALGNITTYLYDCRDELIAVIPSATTEIDISLTLEEIQELANTNPDIRITEYRRDILGHITEIIDALGNSEYYSYNLRGEVSEKTDRDGHVTTYSHTPLGDIASVTYSDGTCAHFEHNALRQLTQVNDWLGTTTLELDALGRTLSVTDHNSKTINYTWTALGQRESITYPNGTKVTHHFDELHRLIKITDGTTEVSYAYDTLSRPISKSFICGKKQTQSFNTFGQLASLKTFAGAELLDSFDISYDALGNKTQITQQRQGLTELDGTYNFTHDALSRLVSVSKGGKTLREYGYDSYHNRVNLTDESGTTKSSFNTLNQLISSSDSTGRETKSVFDKRGNQVEKYINDALVGKYTYGALNRLESTQNLSSNKQAEYHYSGLGHRVAKTTGDLEPTLPHANPTKHIEDTLDLTRQYNNLLERREEGVAVSFVWDASILSANSTTGTDTYLLDYLGSPLRAGEEAFAFDEFGQTLAGNFDTQPFGYTGYQQDDIANTWYAQARQYDSATGRFGAEDPHWHPNNMLYGDSAALTAQGAFMPSNASIVQSSNKYGYCMSGPTGLVDPTGAIADFLNTPIPSPIPWAVEKIDPNMPVLRGVTRVIRENSSVEIVRETPTGSPNWVDQVKATTRSSFSTLRGVRNDVTGTTDVEWQLRTPAATLGSVSTFAYVNVSSTGKVNVGYSQRDATTGLSIGAGSVYKGNKGFGVSTSGAGSALDGNLQVVSKWTSDPWQPVVWHAIAAVAVVVAIVLVAIFAPAIIATLGKVGGAAAGLWGTIKGLGGVIGGSQALQPVLASLVVGLLSLAGFDNSGTCDAQP